MSYKWTRDVATETARQEKSLNGEKVLSSRDAFGALTEYFDLLQVDFSDIEHHLREFRLNLDVHGLEEMELTAAQIRDDAIRTATSAIELAAIAWQAEDYLKGLRSNE